MVNPAQKPEIAGKDVSYGKTGPQFIGRDPALRLPGHSHEPFREFQASLLHAIPWFPPSAGRPLLRTISPQGQQLPAFFLMPAFTDLPGESE
jgi:hypothetical protein